MTRFDLKLASEPTFANRDFREIFEESDQKIPNLQASNL